MCQFVETICLTDGSIKNLKKHNDRFNRTRRAFGWDVADLTEIIREQSFPNIGKYKIRVVYGDAIGLIECTPYETPHLARIGVVEFDEIDYRYKSTKRDCFKGLYAAYPGFDDFIIIKQGFITDSTFCNLALLKDDNWYTPETPLLEGVQRTVLLERDVIKKRNIRITDLNSYSHISFFNALNEHGSHLLPVSCCVYLGKFNPAL